MEDAAAFQLEGDPPGFRIELSFRLPRDRQSVPVVRHLAENALREVGANADDAHDVQLALGEACTNVLTHAGPGANYDVVIVISPIECTLRVVDAGTGFDATLPSPMAAGDAEGGRGLGLMHAVMDQVKLTSEPEVGTIVQLVKRLRFDGANANLAAPARPPDERVPRGR